MTSPLSPSGEVAWQSLRPHLEWTPNFWLGWIFTDHSPSGRELFERAAELLRGAGRNSCVRRPERPAELLECLPWLLAGAEGLTGCVAIEVVRQSPEWLAAWDTFMLRLNERRELLRANLRGGLLFIAPTPFKPRTRDAAPDLWSIRSIVFDVAPPTSPLRARDRDTHDIDLSPVEVAPPSDVTLAEQALAATRGGAHPEAHAEARVRLARALLGTNRLAEARELAVQAIDEAPGPAHRARALELLGDIDIRLDDHVAAVRHYRAALDLGPGLISDRARRNLAGLLRRRGDLEDALAIARTALAEQQELLRARGDSAETLIVESRWHQTMGDILRDRDELAAALDHYQHSLDLNRRARETTGDTRETLRNEVNGHLRMIRVLLVQGNFAAAIDHGEQSLPAARLLGRGDRLRLILRPLQILQGDTPESRDEAFADLLRLADTVYSQGDLSAALNHYREALDDMRLSHMTARLPTTLLLEAHAHRQVGEILRAQGDLPAAVDQFHHSLELVRRLRAAGGDSPEAEREEAALTATLAELRGPDKPPSAAP